MATSAQIEANRRNAELSSGPKTDEGKAASRGNATKHGLAGDLDTSPSAEFLDRRAKWEPEYQPEGEVANWTLDCAVAASLRIDRCERALDILATHSAARARLAWEQDRAIEAATTAGRLAKDPVLASRQLQASLAGVVLLIERWLALAGVIAMGENWSESEESQALDMLGVAPDLRNGLTPIDAPDGANPIAFRLKLALEEADTLKRLRENSLKPLDELERRRAMMGDDALSSKEAKLILRYERDAWKRFHASIKQLKKPEASPVPETPVVTPPPPEPLPATEPPAPPKVERIATTPEPVRPPAQHFPVATDLLDEASRLNALHRKMSGLPPLP